MLGSNRSITVLGQVLDSSSVRCQATPVNTDTLESGGLFGAPFQKWNVQVVLSDGRQSSSSVFIETQCKNATRFLNSSQLLCSRCPPFSFSIQPDAPLCLCEKGSFGTHPACRRCPRVVGFDCSRDNLTSVGKFELNTTSIFRRHASSSAILPGYYLNLEKFQFCSATACPALEKCFVEEACPGKCHTGFIFVLTNDQGSLVFA